MLQIPEKGFRISATKNNIQSDYLGDWIEANLLFSDDIISKSAIVDILIEQHICKEQDIANLIADDGFTELRERKEIAAITEGIIIKGDRLYSKLNWKDDPVRAFLVFLSLFRIYPKWAEDVRNSNEQGELFEKVVEALCVNLFPGWETHRIGWTPSNPVTIDDIINELCPKLKCAGHSDRNLWTTDSTKDGGLDLVCFRSFLDTKQALPTYFIQCASGSNWRDKIYTPSASLWTRLLDSAVSPGTGIAAPFVIDELTLQIKALEGQTIVLDRLRLLSCYYSKPKIVKSKLKKELVKWLAPRVDVLPVF